MHRWLFIALLAYIPATSFSAAAPEQPGIGYQSVEAALDDLKSRSDVDIFEKDGWTIVEDNAAGALWSFTPATHPAHPAAVKRTVVQENGEVFIDTKGLCQAEKTACDQLMVQVHELNEVIGRLVGSGGTRTRRDER
jgi:hypothetical protein